MKKKLHLLLASVVGLSVACSACANGPDNFYKSNKLISQKVSFNNLYRMKVVGNLYRPSSAKSDAKLPAIIVGHPMGAV